MSGSAKAAPAGKSGGVPGIIFSRREASSLVEVLISSLAASVLLSCLTSAMFLPLSEMRRIDDASAARNRADMVFSILRQPLEHCGYGLPKSAGAYAEAFGVDGAPFDWPGPISVETVGVRENGACKIAYAVPSGISAISPAEAASGRLQITASGYPDKLNKLNGLPGNGGNGHDTDDWVLFGAMMPYCVPVKQYAGSVKLTGGAVLSLETSAAAAGQIMVPENDELFYLRVMECTVRKSEYGFVFYAKDYRVPGWQPRVDGVIDVRFEIDEFNRFARVWTLTRGNHKYPGVATPGTPPGWPEKYAGSIPDEARFFKLIGSSELFALKNM